jgi:hypothetical protein
MQHKSILLLIKGADDDSGAFVGLVSTATSSVGARSASHSVAAHADTAGLDAKG